MEKGAPEILRNSATYGFDGSVYGLVATWANTGPTRPST